MDPILVRRQMQGVTTPQSSKQDFLVLVAVIVVVAVVVVIVVGVVAVIAIVVSIRFGRSVGGYERDGGKSLKKSELPTDRLTD